MVSNFKAKMLLSHLTQLMIEVSADLVLDKSRESSILSKSPLQ